MASRFVDAGSVDEFISEQETRARPKNTQYEKSLLGTRNPESLFLAVGENLDHTIE